MLFQEGENFENIHKIYHEYQTAYLTRKEIVDKLYEEIKIIKNYKYRDFWTFLRDFR